MRCDIFKGIHRIWSYQKRWRISWRVWWSQRPRSGCPLGKHWSTSGYGVRIATLLTRNRKQTSDFFPHKEKFSFSFQIFFQKTWKILNFSSKNLKIFEFFLKKLGKFWIFFQKTWKILNFFLKNLKNFQEKKSWKIIKRRRLSREKWVSQGETACVWL